MSKKSSCDLKPLDTHGYVVYGDFVMVYENCAEKAHTIRRSEITNVTMYADTDHWKHDGLEVTVGSKQILTRIPPKYYLNFLEVLSPERDTVIETLRADVQTLQNEVAQLKQAMKKGLPDLPG